MLPLSQFALELTQEKDGLEEKVRRAGIEVKDLENKLKGSFYGELISRVWSGHQVLQWV